MEHTIACTLPTKINHYVKVSIFHLRLCSFEPYNKTKHIYGSNLAYGPEVNANPLDNDLSRLATEVIRRGDLNTSSDCSYISQQTLEISNCVWM